MRANVRVILHLLKLFPMYVIWSVDRVLFYCDSDDLTFAGVDQHEPVLHPQFVNVSLHLACESSSVLIFR